MYGVIRTNRAPPDPSCRPTLSTQPGAQSLHACYRGSVRRVTFLLVISTVVPLLQSAVQTTPPAYRSDNSDWWSQLRGGDDEVIPTAGQEPAASNFRILGINLGGDMFMLNEAWTKLGKAQRVDRGDALSGRSQICYESVQGRPKIRLVFESGEVTDFFNLFADGRTRNKNKILVGAPRTV